MIHKSNIPTYSSTSSYLHSPLFSRAGVRLLCDFPTEM